MKTHGPQCYIIYQILSQQKSPNYFLFLFSYSVPKDLYSSETNYRMGGNMCTRFEIDIDSYPIRISISKERKKLLTSGEVREYKRVRGYVELHELDALHSWIAIRKDQFEILEELLIDFVKSMNFEIKIEITPEKYPVLYKVLKEFEEKGNAWIYHQNLPEIGWIFLTLWVYRYERDIAKYLEEEGIKRNN